MFRPYWAVAASRERVSSALAVAAGSSEGREILLSVVALSCSSDSRDCWVCSVRWAFALMVRFVTRFSMWLPSYQSGAVDQDVQGFVDGGHHAGRGLVGVLVGEQADVFFVQAHGCLRGPAGQGGGLGGVGERLVLLGSAGLHADVVTIPAQTLSGEFAPVPSCEILSAMLVSRAPPVEALRAMSAVLAGPAMLSAAGPVPRGEEVDVGGAGAGDSVLGGRR